MTTTAILAYTPHPAAGRRAERIANICFWQGLTMDNHTFHGIITGVNGSQCVVQYAPLKKQFDCSCQMRQQPCFHALALALLSVTQPALFLKENNSSDAHFIVPSGAQAISDYEPIIRLSEDTTTPLPDGKHQRRLQRLERAIGGFEDLDTWLEDVTRRGLGTIHQESPQFADHIATRMADASLGGLARKLRLCQAQAVVADDWTSPVLATIAELTMVSALFWKRSLLGEGLFADLMDYCGINLRKEDVLAEGERIADEWLVIGMKEETLEDRLEMRRTWLVGQNTRRFGLLIDYGFGAAELPPGFDFGQLLKAEMVFYPSAVPLRLLIQKIEESTTPNMGSHVPMHVAKKNWKEVQRYYAQSISLCPWLAAVPIWIAHVHIKTNQSEDQFYIEDLDQIAANAKISNETYLILHSFCQGNRFELVGEWNGEHFIPFAAAYNGIRIQLH